MALMNIRHNYIKVNILDEDKIQCNIYPDAGARELEKSATSPDIIINKYIELIKEEKIRTNAELKKYNLDKVFVKGGGKLTHAEVDKTAEIMASLADLSNEYSYYIDDLYARDGAKHDYKIIEQYFPDVKNSIPKMLTSLIFTANTADGLETVYTELKTFEKFGVTIDC